MKFALAVALTIGTAVSALAQQAPTAEPVKISDTEAVVVEKTIRGFYETRDEKLEIYDRKKGETVILRLDRLVTTDTDCIKFPTPSTVAICGECTQIVGAGKNAKEGDKYVVWFVVKRGSLVSATVGDVFIKSVNGKPMYTWAQAQDGTWSATLIPDEPAAE